MSLDSCVRYFVIFDKFLSWFNDDLQMSETCTSNNMLSSSTTSRLLALAVLSVSHYHTEVAEKWTSMVLRVNKHNFCLVVIEFQLVYVHPLTYISDTVLYTQLCNIDITIFERYVELSIISIEMIVDSMTSYYLSKCCDVQQIQNGT